ncbi:MAG: LLM class flavin-dependent oxidoreductase [Rhodospirillales bacterium]|jgi:limonene 1,2-monooxygenase
MENSSLRFGVFLGPHHPLDENPTLALERDLELIELLDDLDYDEVWVGEHHSGGFEIIASPEIFIAAAAERTNYIKLGTGVKTVSFHHPLIVADQMVQLDHMTRGRVMFGAGPGALPTDAYQMGVEPGDQRRRMSEALDAIVPLMEGETVSMETDWFTLKNAKLQLGSYSKPMMEMAVTSVKSPSGALCAGKFGAGLLVLGGISDAALETQSENWRICEETAKENGRTVERRQWRITVIAHLAETREQALMDMEFGLQKWVDYSHHVLPASPFPVEEKDPLAWGVESKLLLVGTPEDAIQEIERVQKQTGGFGTFLFFAHNFVSWEATKRSYELAARYVFPHFQSSNAPRQESYDAARQGHSELQADYLQAVDTASGAYQRSKNK